MPATGSPRDRLLDATESLLREAGMAGTGIKDAVERSGAPIGSLYHYFPGGKDQLVSEALGLHAGKSRRLMEHFFDGTRSAAEAVRHLFNTAASSFERQGGHKGCAIGAVTLDLAASDTHLRTICRETFDAWIAVIEPHLPFPTSTARRAFATTIIAAIEGAFVLGRASRSGDAFRAAGACLAAALPVRGAKPIRRSR